MKTKTEQIIEIREMRPYKVPGKPESYSDYNQGWEDACDLILEQFADNATT